MQEIKIYKDGVYHYNDIDFKCNDFEEQDLALNTKSHNEIFQLKVKNRNGLNENKSCFYYIKDNRLAGFLSCQSSGIDLSHYKILYLQQIFVLPEHRKRGIAIDLIDEAILFAQEESIEFMRIDTSKEFGDKLALKYNFEYYGKRIKQVLNYQIVNDFTYICDLRNLKIITIKP